MKSFTIQEAELFANKYYNIIAQGSLLNGYDEQNFLLTNNNGEKFIMKIANNSHNIHFLDAQVKIINHLSESELSRNFQHLILNTEGEPITKIIVEEINYYIRVLTYLEGTFWIDQSNNNEKLYCNLGSFLGKMDRSLENFSHPAMHRHYTWDISTAADANKKLHHINNHEVRRIVGYFLMQ